MSDYGLTPYLDCYDTNKIRVNFNRGCLKQDRPTLLHVGIVNLYIVYEITDAFNVSNYPTLENCLCVAVKLTKNADIDKYGYYSYGIGFDSHGNIIVFGADMSSTIKIDNRKNDILILGKGPIQGLEHTLSAEKNVFD